MKIRILSILLVLALLSLIVSCSQSAPATTSSAPVKSAPAISPATGKVYELKLATSFTANGFQVKGAIQPWIDKIQNETNGRVKITVYAGASLVKQIDEYNAVSKGLVDMVNFAPMVTPGQFPVAEFINLAMLFQDTIVASRVNDEILQKYALNTELKDVKYLWSTTLAPMQLISTKNYQTMADLKGLKILTAGKSEAACITALGASPVVMPMSEVYTSMERGLLDGTFSVWEGMIVFNLIQISKYRVECNFENRGFPVIMNKDTWNSLPKDIQDIITKNSGEDYTVTVGKAQEVYNAGFKQKVADADKAAGNPGFTTLPADQHAAWLAAIKPVWDSYAKDLDSKGLPGQQVLADAASLRDKYTAAK